MPRKKLEELEPAKPVSSNQKPDAEVVVPVAQVQQKKLN